MDKVFTRLMFTQFVCILLCTSGIIIEFVYEADWGFVAITSGSLIFAITAKIEAYLLTKRKDKNHE